MQSLRLRKTLLGVFWKRDRRGKGLEGGKGSLLVKEQGGVERKPSFKQVEVLKDICIKTQVRNEKQKRAKEGSTQFEPINVRKKQIKPTFARGGETCDTVSFRSHV